MQKEGDRPPSAIRLRMQGVLFTMSYSLTTEALNAEERQQTPLCIQALGVGRPDWWPSLVQLMAMWLTDVLMAPVKPSSWGWSQASGFQPHPHEIRARMVSGNRT